MSAANHQDAQDMLTAQLDEVADKIREAQEDHDPQRVGELRDFYADLERRIVELFASMPTAVEAPNSIQKRGRLERTPGSTLLSIAEFLCSRESYEEIFRPTVTDLREEYFAALAEGRVNKATWIRVRGTWSLLSAAGLVTLIRFVKSVVNVARL